MYVSLACVKRLSAVSAVFISGARWRGSGDREVKGGGRWRCGGGGYLSLLALKIDIEHRGGAEGEKSHTLLAIS